MRDVVRSPAHRAGRWCLLAISTAALLGLVAGVASDRSFLQVSLPYLAQTQPDASVRNIMHYTALHTGRLREAMESLLTSDWRRGSTAPNAPQEVKNHYVLETSSQDPLPRGLQKAVFGTGCFWGNEKGFWRLPGVYSTAVGYIGGTTQNPTYEEVCSGRTGHNEVVLVVYDPKKVSYADLLRNFWESHDPTQGMGQGNDRGTQYRSGIYTFNREQQQLAEASKAAYQAALFANGRRPITTEVLEAPEFYYAENYHQQYLAKPFSRPYCSAQPLGIATPPFDEWDVPGLKAHAPKLPDAYWKQYGPKPGCTISGPNTQNKWP